MRLVAVLRPLLERAFGSARHPDLRPSSSGRWADGCTSRPSAVPVGIVIGDDLVEGVEFRRFHQMRVESRLLAPLADVAASVTCQRDEKGLSPQTFAGLLRDFVSAHSRKPDVE